MSLIYCVKCRKKTDTKNLTQTTLKNGRPALNGVCGVCGTKKIQFIKGSSKKGRGIMNKFINNLPFEMHLPGHNFTGPGTNLKKRLNPDLTPKSWSKPVNHVDRAAMHHDICYLKHTDTPTRNSLCDVDMLKELKGIYNPTLRERLDRAFVTPIIGSKVRFGMVQGKKKSYH